MGPVAQGRMSWMHTAQWPAAEQKADTAAPAPGAAELYAEYVCSWPKHDTLLTFRT